MIYNLVLNSTNVIDSINKTQYAYTFINANFYIPENSKLCISQCMIPYSWFNINSTLYNNNSFSYVWYYGNGLSKTYTVTIPNGFYSISDIQQYLEVYMISQNQYFTNTITGQNLYYIYLSSNSTYYAIQLICYPLPSSLPSSYAAPTSGFNYNNNTNYGYCNTNYTYTPQIIISSSNNFKSIVGYSAGTYPSTLQQTTYNTLGTDIPNLTPVNSLIVQCSIINNYVASPSNILDCIPINNVSFGSNISYVPSYTKFINCSSGTFHDLILRISDQNFNTIQANDSNILISLLLETPDPIYKSISEKNKIKNIEKLLFLEN